MKLLKEYFQRLDEDEKFRTVPGDPIDFMNYVLQYRPDLEDMTDEQVDMLVDVLEGVQVYEDDYGSDGITKVEKDMKFTFADLYKQYRYRHNPALNVDSLEPDGEQVYEYLVRRTK